MKKYDVAVIGVRESRMIEGEYTLTEGDLLNLTKFDDAIAYGRYSIDIHSPDGTGTHLHHFKKRRVLQHTLQVLRSQGRRKSPCCRQKHKCRPHRTVGCAHNADCMLHR